jgi:hypothetical protein
VTRIDPDLEPPLVRHVVLETISSRRQHHFLQLYWELDARPELLTGRGAEGSRRVITLIERLRQVGSQMILPPVCTQCGRERPLTRSIQGERVCNSCYNDGSAETCTRCQKRKPVGGRGPDQQPLCRHCWTNLPKNREICSGCGQRREVHRRGQDGQPLCRNCHRLPTAICSICGRERPCFLSTTPTPRCESCSVTPKPCAHCGETKQIVGRSPDGPLCAPCYRRDPSSLRTCTLCGIVEHLYRHGLCARCACDQQIHALLSGPSGLLRPEFKTLHTALLASDPARALTWLQRSPAVRTVITEIASDAYPLTHETIDERLPGKAGAHLRAILVAAQALPPRDEHLNNVERWLTTAVAHVDDQGDQRTLRAYITWHQLSALRRQLRRKPVSENQISVIRRCVGSAVALLNWLRTSGKPLVTCTQTDIDEYLTTGPASRYHARQFLLWASDHGYADDVTIPVISTKTHITPTGEHHRWITARKLLNDDTINLEDRFAGLLVLLYAQPLTDVVQLTVHHVNKQQQHVLLKLGSTPLRLPPPLDLMLTRLIAERRGHASVGRTNTSPWLFPGGLPGRPISTDRLRKRLQRLGISPRPARASALLDLSAQMPAAVLHKLLGVSIRTATSWTCGFGSSWSDYAAQIQRRPT